MSFFNAQMTTKLPKIETTSGTSQQEDLIHLLRLAKAGQENILNFLPRIRRTSVPEPALSKCNFRSHSMHLPSTQLPTAQEQEVTMVSPQMTFKKIILKPMPRRVEEGAGYHTLEQMNP